MRPGDVPRRIFHVLMLACLVGFSIACSREPERTTRAVDAREFHWKLVTAWPPNLPVTHDAIVQFATDVAAMSSGRLHIEVYAGGELIPPLQVFDAVSLGAVEMGHAAAYYWAGKVPAGQFFAAVPFGMNLRGMWAWLYGDEGRHLWREIYAPYNVVPIPMGNTGMQMGGWFNKEIKSVADIKGLKMRIPGLGGKVLAEAGGNPILLSGAEVYTALERGNIDATEWVGPHHDLRFGLDAAARYYYYPGWHEPGTQMELIVNREAWESLPPDLRLIVESAAAKASLTLYGRMEVENAKSYRDMRAAGKVEMREFPTEVLRELKAKSATALNAEADKNSAFAAVYAAYRDFWAMFQNWAAVTDNAYLRFEMQTAE